MDAAWEQTVLQAQRQIQEDERAALKRVARGTATYVDALLLASSLNHQDLFALPTENKITETEDDPE